MCPVFLARGEGEVLRDQQEALACRMKQVGLLNPRFADDAVMLKDADHFAIPRDDPAAAHVGGSFAFALIYYTGCSCGGLFPDAVPTSCEYEPLKQQVRMLRFIKGLNASWGRIAPLSPITGPWAARNRDWTEDDWE
ncbi:hypothetical protein EMIHUDRAFT_460644 [Emiliania huxleyi CCMP1516]|uniref:Uncharacterized protein n=2 Tax=Emiliania huxleyi TaxID=2903 RepID=A0A0D3KAZ5_EMIH1|nr:hypothetical protein EMIHUDRAFT_460644 [Emiliania huxleyi CCMP1516]EOD32930.1 hypothetical protein EMIHUDRAFT_460644 [Emiliania huxleyi CCMP1516]|eukprot:XP_005785359.1 hypothetical protein EMIHUDRAFT_460644 [Emiliania huxleyi CCMP1516]